jgi:uncharacterized RDD family membrane protein YckC
MLPRRTSAVVEPPASSSHDRATDPIASPARRLLAGLFDVVLVIVAGVAYTIVFGTDQPRRSVSMNVNRHVVNGAGVIPFVVLVLVHFLLLEVVLGVSIGKFLTRLRVRMEDGGGVTLRAAVIRTILRPVDGLPYFIPNLLGFIVLANGPKHQRIGDRLAGTVVTRI